jgi:hypothetical protein
MHLDHLEQTVKVSSVWEDHTYLAEQRCSCGGDYRSLRWELDFENERQLELVHTKCNSCGAETRLWLDVSAAFQPHAQNYIKAHGQCHEMVHIRSTKRDITKQPAD